MRELTSSLGEVTDELERLSSKCRFAEEEAEVARQDQSGEAVRHAQTQQTLHQTKGEYEAIRRELSAARHELTRCQDDLETSVRDHEEAASSAAACEHAMGTTLTEVQSKLSVEMQATHELRLAYDAARVAEGVVEARLVLLESEQKETQETHVARLARLSAMATEKEDDHSRSLETARARARDTEKKSEAAAAAAAQVRQGLESEVADSETRVGELSRTHAEEMRRAEAEYTEALRKAEEEARDEARAMRDGLASTEAAAEKRVTELTSARSEAMRCVEAEHLEALHKAEQDAQDEARRVHEGLSENLAAVVMTKAFRRLISGAKASAIAQWRAFAARARDAETDGTKREVAVRRCLARMTHLTKARMLGQWAEAARQAREHRHKVGLAARRWQRRELMAALECWLALVDQRCLCRRVMNKILRRYMNAAKAHGLSSWRARIIEGREEEEQNRQREIVGRRCALRFAQLAAARAFGRWSEAVQEVKEYRVLVRRCALRMSQRMATRTFGRWVEVTQELKEHRHKVGLAVRRWQRRSLGAVVDCWCGFVENRVLCRRVISKVLRRRLHSSQAAAMSAWRVCIAGFAHQAEEEKRATDIRRRREMLMKRCGARIVHQTQSETFYRWAEYILLMRTDRDSANRHDEEERRREQVVLRCAARIGQRVAARAFIRWAEAMQEAKELRHKTGLAVRRWQKRELREVMDCWFLHVDNRIVCRRVMNKILRRYMNAAKAHGLSSWRARIIEGREEEEQNRQREIVGRRCALRFAQLAAARAFGRWSEAVQEVKEYRVLVRRCALRMSQRMATRTFGRWVEVTQELKEHRHKVGLAVRRWQRRSLGAVVDCWCGFVENRVLCRRVISKVLRRRLHSSQAAAMSAWRVCIAGFAHQAEEEKRATDIRRRREMLMKRCGARIVHQTQSETFYRWAEYILLMRTDRDSANRHDEEERRREQVVLRCAARIGQRVAARAFIRWAEAMQEAKELRHKTGLAVRRWQKRELRAILDCWFLHVDNRTVCRRVMNKILRRYMKAAQSHGFSSWCYWTSQHRVGEEEQVRREVVVRRCAAKLAKRSLGRTLLRWIESAQEVREHRHKVGLAVRRWQRRPAIVGRFLVLRIRAVTVAVIMLANGLPTVGLTSVHKRPDTATRHLASLFFAASLLHRRDRHERLLSTAQMHGAGARTPAVAALVVVVKEPMLLLHHLPLTCFLQ